MAPRPLQAANVDSQKPEIYEDRNVHAIYDDIATHFSSTRYKPWPIIAKFLSGLTTGWVGLDSGTGNGKYLPLPLDRPGDIWTIGLDRSSNLLQIAKAAGASGVVREVLLGNVLDVPWRLGVFDYAISIAIYTIFQLMSEGGQLSSAFWNQSPPIMVASSSMCGQSNKTSFPKGKLFRRTISRR